MEEANQVCLKALLVQKYGRRANVNHRDFSRPMTARDTPPSSLLFIHRITQACAAPSRLSSHHRDSVSNEEAGAQTVLSK